MIESCYGLTDCPKCGKMVAIVISPEWADARYMCMGCGHAFEFRIVERNDDVDG